MRATTAVLTVLLFAAIAYGDSYPVPQDYRVVCLDLATGKPVWQHKPALLGMPTISANDRVVVAESRIHVNVKESKIVRYYLDAANGKPLAKVPKLPLADLTGPLSPLVPNLKAADGTVFQYDRGNTRHLISVKDGKSTLVKRLERFPYDINIAGNLAIYTFAGGVGIQDTGGGDVYAYDLKQQRMAWTFQASSIHRNLPPASYTGVAVDGDRVLVSVDQSINALALASGKLRWRAALPRQTLLRYGHPWTKIGRHGDTLIVACYEGLFVLQREDGKLIWSFDCGQFGSPWPTIKGDRVYVGTRGA